MEEKTAVFSLTGKCGHSILVLFLRGTLVNTVLESCLCASLYAPIYFWLRGRDFAEFIFNISYHLRK